MKTPQNLISRWQWLINWFPDYIYLYKKPYFEISKNAIDKSRAKQGLNSLIWKTSDNTSDKTIFINLKLILLNLILILFSNKFRNTSHEVDCRRALNEQGFAQSNEVAWNENEQEFRGKKLIKLNLFASGNEIWGFWYSDATR